MKLNEYLNKPEVSKLDFASNVGVTPGMVSQWISGARPISAEKCLAIWRYTNFQVSREEMRPDDYWKIWPDLTEPKKAA
jgi:DNA-binding transcriptional regulator YdaS (Cro superfamily)